MRKFILLIYFLFFTSFFNIIFAKNVSIVDTIIVKDQTIVLYNLSFSKPDSCGDVKMISSIGGSYHARVKRIITPELLEVILVDDSEIPKFGYIDKNIKLVHLAGISPLNLNKSQYDFVMIFLNEVLLDKKIKIYSQYIQISEVHEFNGEVETKKISINYTLLKNGLVEYNNSNTGGIDFWTICHLRKATH